MDKCICEPTTINMPRWEATNRWNRDKIGTPTQVIICDCEVGK